MSQIRSSGAQRGQPKLRPNADADLIARVRTRPVLYNPTHSRYMDSSLKFSIWNRIAKELNSSPIVCKTRWNNIRDNYRKSLRRRNVHQFTRYKYSSLLGFMEPFYKTLDRALPVTADTPVTAENEGTQEQETYKNTEDETESVEDNDDRASNDTQLEEEEKAPPDTPTNSKQFEAYNIKVDRSDVEAEQTESMLDYETYFEKSASVSGSTYTPQGKAVDAFLAALAPPLKALSPYHLSLAKAEIFATVHKYELKGLVERGWGGPDVNPLP